MAAENGSLKERLSGALPVGTNLKYYHISTPPTKCAALYNAPTNFKAERTFCEYQSLLVVAAPGQSIDQEVAIFAIEIQIYTTSRLTTVFVSKADSTGYASILNTARATSSVLQSITRTFVSWIIQHRQTPSKRLVLSLFARAQDQYLFPGSVENKEKHILNDRQLVKWWCKTLDPILREYEPEDSSADATGGQDGTTSKAYLVVPGHDSYETLSFFPQTARLESAASRRWVAGHPLTQIAPEPNAPPRCLVPHFPDDPKSRYLDELDYELADVPSTQQIKHESPTKRGRGHWKSVKTLDQFWDAMAFRQECSSGRLVGFIWIVFTPSTLVEDDDHETTLSTRTESSSKRKVDIELDRQEQVNKRPKVAHRKRTPSGPIHPRAPRVKSFAGAHDPASPAKPETTRYYHVPHYTRGNLVLRSKGYDRVHEILLRLDFTGLEAASASTKKWIEETTVISGHRGRSWGVEVRGSLEVLVAPRSDGLHRSQQSENTSDANGSTTNMLTVKKKPKSDAQPVSNGSITVLGGGLVRKKLQSEPAGADPLAASNVAPAGVNTLGSGLVRKKAKAS